MWLRQVAVTSRVTRTVAPGRTVIGSAGRVRTREPGPGTRGVATGRVNRVVADPRDRSANVSRPLRARRSRTR